MDPVLLQLQKDLADAQNELKTAQKDRQTAEKEKQKADKAYTSALDKQQKALDALADANDNLKQAQNALTQAIKDYSDEINRMLSETTSLESDTQKARGQFEAGEYDDFPDALSSDIDSLAFEVDNFSVDIGSYERAVQSAQKVVTTAKASATKAVNFAVKKQAEVTNADTALYFAQQNEADAQRKVDAAQDALNNYNPSPFKVTYNSPDYLQRVAQAKADIPRLQAALAQAQAADAAQGSLRPSKATLFAQFRLTDAEELANSAHTERISSNAIWNRMSQPTLNTTTSRFASSIGLSPDTWTDAGKFPFAFDKPGGSVEIHDYFEKSFPDARINDANINSDVVTYTGSAYTPINDRLLGKSNSNRYDSIIDGAKRRLATCGLPFDMTVIRGLKYDYGEYIGQLNVGDIFVSKAFSSTSILTGVANGFDGRALVVIRAKAGTACMEVSKISMVKSECEILFPPGLTLQVDDKQYTNKGVPVIICHVI